MCQMFTQMRENVQRSPNFSVGNQIRLGANCVFMFMSCVDAGYEAMNSGFDSGQELSGCHRIANVVI